MTTTAGWRAGAAWSLSGGVLAGALMYLATLLAGRLLGPAEFGQVAFALTLAQLGAIACVRGLDFATARWSVLSRSRRESGGFVGTGYVLAGANALALAVVLCLVAAPLADSLGWARTSIIGAAALLLPASLRAMNERVAPAVGMTRTLASVRPAEGALLLTLLVALSAFALVRPGTVLAAMAVCAFGVSATLVALMRRRGLLARPGTKARRTMSGYATLMLVLTLAPLPLQYGDRLFVQHGLDASALGLYVACATATQVVASQIVSLLSGVLLPGIVREGPAAIGKLRTLAAAVSAPGVLLFGGTLSLSLWLLGSSFRPSLALVGLFACLGAVQLTNGLLHVAVIAHPAAARIDVRATIARSVFYVCILLVLVQVDALTLEAVVGSLLVLELAHTALLSWLTSWASRHWAATELQDGARVG